MAGIQPLPGGGNPWAQALPGFVQQLAMMKVRQNFIAKEAEMKREDDKVQLERERIYQEEQLKKRQEFTSGENQKNRDASMARIKEKPETPTLKTKTFTGADGKVYSQDRVFNPRTKTLENIGEPYLGKQPSKGTQLTVEDGKTTFSQGGQGDVGKLTSTNQTAVQKDLIDINDRMQRLSGIIGKYKSGYQNVFTRVGMSWDALKDKTGLGKQLTPEKRTALQEYSTYKKEAVREFGLEIQRLAKGNLTKNEAKLYGKGLPNPGTGWFDGDSPAEFEGALRTSYKNLDKIRARKHYYLNKLNYTQPQIDSLLDNESILSVDAFMGRVDEIAQKREAEIIQQLQASGQPVNPGMVKDMVKKFLNDEFGFRF